MTETMTTDKQIEDWKIELTCAMGDQRWRRALQLCSWLRYALGRQERSDSEVEQDHQRAKEALAGQVAEERAQRARQRNHHLLRVLAANQIASGTWMQALDSIEAFYQNGAGEQEALGLLQELKRHLSDHSFLAHPHQDPMTEALVQRFNQVLAQVRSDA